MQCLKSITESDLSTDAFEIIIVDDASTDNSLEIAEKFKNVYPDISCRILVNDINLGLIRSRNRGIHHAKGSYVFFLDADNFIGKDCLRKHWESLQKNPDVVACYSRIQRFSDENGQFCGITSADEFSYRRLLEGPYIDAMAMFRKDALIRLGLYDSNMPSFGWEDYELWLRVGKAGEKVIFIEGPPLSCCRMHIRNMGLEVNKDKYNQIIYFLRSKYPVQLNFTKTELFTQIQKNKFYYAQLFYTETSKEAFSEEKSIVSSLNERNLRFSLPHTGNFNHFRFDPLNDYVKIIIYKIIFKNKGEILNLEYSVSSNAIMEAKNVFLFNTEDPQMVINLDTSKPKRIDEIEISMDILKRGQKILVTQHLL